MRLSLTLPRTLLAGLLLAAPVTAGLALVDGPRAEAASRASGAPTRQGLPARSRRIAPAKPAGKAVPLVAPVASVAGPAHEAPPPDQRDPDRDRIIGLQEALASIVHGPVLGSMRVGVRVIEAATGRTFFRQSGSQLMDPASNQKVLATTAAIMRLGADFRFYTEVYGPTPSPEGVVDGDVVLRGSGDPSLEATELVAMANEMARRGITRIQGDVVADPRRIGASETAVDERSPLRVTRSAVMVRVRPTTDGAPPLVIIRPELDEIVVRNRAITRARGRGRVKLSFTAGPEGRMVLELKGTISSHHPGMVMSRMPPSQRLYAAALLRDALKDAGIAVQGSSRVGEGRNGLPLLVSHRSAPLSVIIRKINKDSNNEWAERLMENVGAELYGGPATPDKGLRALREAMDEVGLPRESYVSTNASGLGHSNRLTADAIAELLQKLYSDPRWGPELLQSLSVGGVDGTIRNRFRASPAAERVRAKTGTLNGKSILSGYVGDGQEVLVFSILVEGRPGRRFGTTAVRNAQVSAVDAMMRFARGVIDVPPGQEGTPGVDFETGEDVIEVDGEESGPSAKTPAAAPGGAAAATGTAAAGTSAQLKR